MQYKKLQFTTLEVILASGVRKVYTFTPRELAGYKKSKEFKKDRLTSRVLHRLELKIAYNN